MNLNIKINNVSASWRYLIIVMIIYLFFLIFDQEIFTKSLDYCGAMVSEVLQAFFLVFVLMVMGDYFITPSFIAKHFKKNYYIKWFVVIIGGIISAGPIYMWYPLLGDLRKKFLDNGMVACFLYNRAIKIPLIPIALIYFNWSYILILFMIMVFISVIQGMLINYLLRRENENCFCI